MVLGGGVHLVHLVVQGSLGCSRNRLVDVRRVVDIAKAYLGRCHGMRVAGVRQVVIVGALVSGGNPAVYCAPLGRGKRAVVQRVLVRPATLPVVILEPTVFVDDWLSGSRVGGAAYRDNHIVVVGRGYPGGPRVRLQCPLYLCICCRIGKAKVGKHVVAKEVGGYGGDGRIDERGHCSAARELRGRRRVDRLLLVGRIFLQRQRRIRLGGSVCADVSGGYADLAGAVGTFT